MPLRKIIGWIRKLLMMLFSHEYASEDGFDFRNCQKQCTCKCNVLNSHQTKPDYDSLKRKLTVCFKFLIRTLNLLASTAMVHVNVNLCLRVYISMAFKEVWLFRKMTLYTYVCKMQFSVKNMCMLAKQCCVWIWVWDLSTFSKDIFLVFWFELW